MAVTAQDKLATPVSGESKSGGPKIVANDDDGKLYISEEQMGEVQATPTEYTLLRRLKDLVTGATVAVTGMGEVQATPTEYTLLRRLKDLVTGIVLSTGSAIIGRVGHDRTGVADGVVTVTTPLTDVPLAASSTPAKVVIVQAQTDNTDAVAVGGEGVVATIATGTGIVLYAGDSVTLEIDDLADVWIDALAGGEGVRFTYMT